VASVICGGKALRALQFDLKAVCENIGVELVNFSDLNDMVKKSSTTFNDKT